MSDTLAVAIGFAIGVVSSATFILVLFAGFCTLVGFTKLRATAGGDAPVVKSLDEVISREPFAYLASGAPRGPVDQLRSPELTESAARRS